MKTPGRIGPRAGRTAQAPSLVALENIEALRLQAGIDDIELRTTIARLRVGDLVNLTFLVDRLALVGPTLAVQVTSIRGSKFRGTIAAKPGSGRRAGLRLGLAVAFTAHHIHSIPRRRAGP